MNNLLINGCSFTQDFEKPTWSTFLKNRINPNNYINLAADGCGNEYICKSTINYLETHQIDSTDTLIIIMWSGTGRKDISISGEWWYHLKKTYSYLAKSTNEEEYYLFSGGLTNSWLDNSFTKNTFFPLYKVSDPLSLTLDSLFYFNVLKNYLENNGYQYKFTNYFDYWSSNIESVAETGDYSIGWFCKDHPIFLNFNFSNWICTNQDSLGNYASNLNQLDDTGHPTTLAHSKFVEEVLINLINISK